MSLSIAPFQCSSGLWIKADLLDQSPFNTREVLTFLAHLTSWASPELSGKVEPISPYVDTEAKWSLQQITAPGAANFIIWHHLLSQTDTHSQDFILMMNNFVTQIISSISLSNQICPPTASLSNAQRCRVLCTTVTSAENRCYRVSDDTYVFLCFVLKFSSESMNSVCRWQP